MKFPSSCQCIKISGAKCNSTLLLQKFVFFSPDLDEPISIPICRIDSDWILNTLLLFDRAKLDEIKAKRLEKQAIIRAYSMDARNAIREIDKQIEVMFEELKAIRFDHCRYCDHDLSCFCQKCKNDTEKKFLLIVMTSQNTFRHAFHLHFKCASSLLSRCGYDHNFSFEPAQTLLTP